MKLNVIIVSTRPTRIGKTVADWFFPYAQSHASGFDEVVLTDLAELDLPPSAVGFIDDASANVETAEALGIATYHHPPTGGIEALREGVEHLLR